MKKLLMLGLIAAAFVLPNCGKKSDSKPKKSYKVEKSNKGMTTKGKSKKGESKKSWSKKGTSKKGESTKSESKKGFGFSKK